MQKVLLIIALFLMSFTTRDNPIKSDCTYNGIPLFGRVEVVKIGADFKVEVVNALPDIDIDTTWGKPIRCGQWQIVKGCSDFKIEYVKLGADIKIRFVKSFPGIK